MKTNLKALALSAGLIWTAQAQAQKTSRDLATVDGLSKVKVIVQWKTPLNATKTQKLQQRGGVFSLDHPSIKASTYTLPASEVNGLANDPDVAFISLDRPVRSKLDYTAAAVNASYVWSQGFDGAGIAVAVIDSGMNSNNDLTQKSNIVYNQDFTGKIKADGNVANTNNAPDLYGHGQHVAGIIASSGKTSSCGNCTRLLLGIAPGVNLVNLRVLDETGTGTDSMVIAAIEKAIALKSVYNIRVINLSLGRPVYESYTLDPLCQAVEQAWKAGIAVVVAAGNDGRDDSFGSQGYGTITAPGNDPYVITVGAMKTEGTYGRTDDLIASYSSKGPTQIDHVAKPDIVAPGNQVVSLLASTKATLVAGNPANNVAESFYQGSNSSHASNAYFMLSGTSMATPVVSAGIADLLQARPTLTPDQVKALIMQTAYKTFPESSTAADPASGRSYLDYYDIFTVGAGYLDLEAALKKINSAPTALSALSPTALYNPNSGQVTLSTGTSTSWGSQAGWDMQTVWGTKAVWGTSAVWGTQAVWGTKAVWGAGSILSFESVWGASAIWGQQSVAATKGIWGADIDAAEAASVAVHGEQ